MQYEVFALIKPDAVDRGLVGKVITKIERKGFQLIRMEMRTLGPALVTKLYEKFSGKEFLPDLVEFMTSGPCVAMIAENPYSDAISEMRKLVGATGPDPPGPATIRGEFAESFRRNIIHASDSEAAVAREIRMFFPGYLE